MLLLPLTCVRANERKGASPWLALSFLHFSLRVLHFRYSPIVLLCTFRRMLCYLNPTQGGPDLKKYLDKRLRLKLNANRRVTGVLRGFDQFMNIVLDESIEEVSAAESNAIGMVVIRGNSVVQFECLDRL